MRGYVTLDQQEITVGENTIFQCVYVRKSWHKVGLIRWEKLYREVLKTGEFSWRLAPTKILEQKNLTRCDIIEVGQIDHYSRKESETEQDEHETQTYLSPIRQIRKRRVSFKQQARDEKSRFRRHQERTF